MKLISYLIRCAIAALSLVPWYLLGILVGLVDQRNGLRIFVSWNRFFLRLFRIEVSVHNENHTTESLSGCVFILLNQTSLLDSGIGGIAIPLPWRGIVNIEFTLIPLFGWAMWIFCWVIIRQWSKQAKRAMQQVKPFLQSGGMAHYLPTKRGQSFWQYRPKRRLFLSLSTVLETAYHTANGE